MVDINKQEEESKPKKQHGSLVMISIPKDVAERVENTVAKSIPLINLMAEGAFQANHSHITLLYIGKVANKDLASLIKRVSKVAKAFAPFTVKMRGTARYPRGDDGTVMVGKVEGISLTTLHKALQQALPEAEHQQQFMPNVALAYIKPGYNDLYITSLNETWAVDTIILSTPQKQHEIKLKKAKRELIVAASSVYYDLTPNTSVDDVAKMWRDAGKKVYDRSMPKMYATADLMPYREYDWTRTTSRSGTLRVKGEEVYVTGPARWDFIVEELRADGWKEDDPLVIVVGKEGGVKVSEGNHRLAVAKILNIDKVPVRFEFDSGKVAKMPTPAKEEEPGDIDTDSFLEEVENADGEHHTALFSYAEERAQRVMTRHKL